MKQPTRLVLLLLVLLCVKPCLLSAANDPYLHSSGSWGQSFADQWGYSAVGLDSDALKSFVVATPVVVAVIDTGLDYYHPDLASSTIWRNTKEVRNGVDDDNNGYIDDMIGWNFVEDDNNPWDNSGHGTHIAGLIAAATNNNEGIAGINPNAQIMPLKVLNFVGRGRSTRIAKAIYYAVHNGARIINLSLGGEHISQMEKLAVDYAYQNNVLVVIASGNSGIDTSDYGPAALGNAITVGASDPEGNVAEFSNWGGAIDIVAPGVDILSLRARYTDLALVARQENYQPGQGFVGEDNRYYIATGTSFAAPFVAGVASLMIAQNPELSVDEIRQKLILTAKDLGDKGHDIIAGFGQLDAVAALAPASGEYVIAAITQSVVSNESGKYFLTIHGSANAERFKRAWLELGVGDDPSAWKVVGSKIKRPINDGVLTRFNTSALAGAKLWTLRLTVEDKNGVTRESRYKVRAGQ